MIMVTYTHGQVHLVEGAGQRLSMPLNDVLGLIGALQTAASRASAADALTTHAEASKALQADAFAAHQGRLGF